MNIDCKFTFALNENSWLRIYKILKLNSDKVFFIMSFLVVVFNSTKLDLNV